MSKQEAAEEGGSEAGREAALDSARRPDASAAAEAASAAALDCRLAAPASGKSFPLVGRGRERELIVERLEEVWRAGRGRCLLLLGAAGTGKSRLVAEVRSSFASRHRWIGCRALPRAEGEGCAMVRALLLELAGTRADEPQQRLREALRACLGQAFGEEGSGRSTLLSNLVGVEVSRDERTTLDSLAPEMLRRRTAGACVDLLVAIATRSPLVIVWEDLHWADASSIEVLEALVARLPEAPLLVVGVLRSEHPRARQIVERIHRAAAGRGETLELAPLNARDSQRLVKNLLAIRHLPDPVRTLVVDGAEGNALYLEELVRLLMDAGAVAVRGERAVMHESLRDLRVPETLEGVIADRVARLSPERRKLLQSASVIGRIFQSRLLERLFGSENVSAALSRSLERLAESAFIRTEVPGAEGARASQSFIFKHACTQEAVYDSIPEEQRRALHETVAQSLEALFPTRIEELAGLIARHYENAGRREQAFHLYLRAARGARARFANQEAILSYRSALAQLPDAPEAEALRRARWDALEELGGTLAQLGQYQEAVGTFERVVAEAPLDPVRRARVRRKLGGADRSSPDARFAHWRSAEEALGSEPKSEAADWWEERIAIELDRISAHYGHGQLAELAERVAAAEPAVARWATLEQRSAFHSMVSLARLRQLRCRPDAAVFRSAEASLEAARGTSNSVVLARSLFRLGFLHVLAFGSGGHPVAAQLLGEALLLATRTGDVVFEARSLAYLALLQRLRGDLSATEGLLERSLEAARASDLAEHAAMAEGNRAWVELCHGRLEAARAAGMRALDFASGRRFLDTPHEWMARLPLMELALRNGAMAELREHAARILDPSQLQLPGGLERKLRCALAGDSAEGGPVASFEDVLDEARRERLL